MKTAQPSQEIRLIDENFRANKTAYLLQCALATGYILLVYLALEVLREGWTVASLGASTFIAFSFPKLKASRPRALVGGYAAATLTGSVLSMLCSVLTGLGISASFAICCALAMFSTMLLMVCFDCEHPPAAALAFTLIQSDQALTVGMIAIACVAILCLLKQFLLPRLMNL